MTGLPAVPATGAESEQRLTAGGGVARAPAWRPGGHGGPKRGLDGIGDKLRGLRVDGDIAAQHAADGLPGVPGRVLRSGGHYQPPARPLGGRVHFVDQWVPGQCAGIGIRICASASCRCLA